MSKTVDVQYLWLAMNSLDNDYPGIFNIIGISEPDTLPVAEALAQRYEEMTPSDFGDEIADE